MKTDAQILAEILAQVMELSEHYYGEIEIDVIEIEGGDVMGVDEYDSAYEEKAKRIRALWYAKIKELHAEFAENEK